MPSTFLTDFPDRLSPMLVKELRQGMRARGFVLLFLIFQCLLAFILIVAGSSLHSEGSGTFASGVIFSMFSIAVLVIQPMRGVSALSSEITGNTIEMMVLTRLTARRIVFGKWIAIVSQSALILTTIIPYLILRYFFGGMVLAGELVLLGLIFLTSMALTAVMVGMSATSAKLVRFLPALGLILAANTLPSVMMFGRFGIGTGGMSFFTLATTDAQIAVASYLSFIGYIGWCALSHGTSAIAPVSENHTTLRRLIAVVLTLIGVGLAFHPQMNAHALTFIFAVILTPALFASLTEPAILLPPLFAPFAKFGLAGRIASIFLLPGWAAGVFFTTLLIALSSGGIAICTNLQPHFSYGIEAAIVPLGLLGGVLLPALLSAIFSKQESKRLTNFLLFLIGSIVITVAALFLSSLDHKDHLLWAFIWNPPVVLNMLRPYHFDQEHVLTAICVVDGIYLLLLLIAAAAGLLRYRREMIGAESIPATATDTAPHP